MASLVSSPVFVGRQHEVERIVSAIAAAQSGRPSCFFVAGEAGVGKTRLVDEVGARARAAGARVLSGGCIDLGGEGLPFAPIVEALRGLTNDLAPETLHELAGPGRAELVRLLPGLGAPVEEASGVGLTYASAQGRLFELLLGLFSRLARAEEPLVLVVEDIHWADRSTLELLSFLVRNLRHAAIVLLATYRSDELHRRHPLLPFLAEIERGRRAERIELRRFDRREVGQQLEAILGGEPERGLLDRIFVRSEGNAFFAEELLAAGGADRDAPDQLPETLREVLLARVGRLSDATQELLRDAAAGGRDVSIPLLSAVTGTAERDLTEGLREAVARQVLVPRVGGGGPAETAGWSAADERYAFRHALVQEAIYGDLLPGERVRLHAAFARALADDPRVELDASRAAELAHHWYAAHDMPRALDASIKAGTAAEAVLAAAEAQAQYERALELWDQVADAEARSGLDRIALLERAAQASSAVAIPRAVAHTRTAVGLVDPVREPVRAGLLQARLGMYLWLGGEGEAALAALRRAVELVPADPPTPEGARVLAGLGQILMLSGQFRDAEETCVRAIGVARAVRDTVVEAHALNTMAVAQVYGGDMETAVANMRRSLEIATGAGSGEDVIRAYNNLAAIDNSIGRFEDALADSRECFRQAERLGLLRFFGIQAICEAVSALYFLGRWDEAEEELDRVTVMEPEGMNEVYALECRATLEAGRGAFESARGLLARIERILDKTLDPEYIAPVIQLHAELDVWQGLPGDARRTIEAGLARLADAQELGVSWIGPLYALGVRAEADLAELATARRPGTSEPDRAAATRLLEATRAMVERMERHQPVFGGQARAYLALCEAEMSRLDGASSPERWAAAADAWAGLQMPYPQGYALWRQGEALLAAGRPRAEAAEPLRQARAIAEGLGARPLLREVDALAARARIGLEASAGPAVVGVGPGLDPAATLGLTPRESEVLRLVAAGRTNRQIGEALFISEKTAGVHVSNILGKLGVAGRTEAAAVAYKLGLTIPASGLEATLGERR